MKFDFRANEHGVFDSGARRWGKLLRALKVESGIPLYDDSFEKWALDVWGIRFLHESTEYPGHLTGVELDDATYTMLLLKFQID